MKEGPEQLAQSGWHLTQEPEDENVLDGQVDTHCPEEARRPELHVRQKSAEPRHVPQLEEQAKDIVMSRVISIAYQEHAPVQVRLSCGETKVPVGQLATHLPCERTKPGKQPLHCS